MPAVLLGSLIAGSAGAADTVVIASGLNNPRGIDIGPDGRIAVAEAGAGRIARIKPGSVTTLVGTFQSGQREHHRHRHLAPAGPAEL